MKAAGANIGKPPVRGRGAFPMQCTAGGGAAHLKTATAIVGGVALTMFRTMSGYGILSTVKRSALRL